MKRGVIFDIKELSFFDGPGLRQTVFLKGCPLRCNWCHNPEGLSVKPQAIATNVTCDSCGCVQKIWEDNTCKQCGKTVTVLPRVAGEGVSSVELIKRIKKNANYYENYGGGVTFSGGEPLMQAPFLIEVLEGLGGMHTAIETSGYCREDYFKTVIDNLDFVMIDLKLMNTKQHKFHTGVSNDLIIQNVKTLCNETKPFIVRIPLIPGVNDNEAHFKGVAELVGNAKHLQKIELLPYHQTAGAKYSLVGKKYEPKFDVEADIESPVSIFEKYGIRSEIL